MEERKDAGFFTLGELGGGGGGGGWLGLGSAHQNIRVSEREREISHAHQMGKIEISHPSSPPLPLSSFPFLSPLPLKTKFEDR